MTEFFDEFGRGNPAGISAAVHPVIRRRFVCAQPKIDYPTIFNRLKSHLAPDIALTPGDFEKRAEAILAGLRSDPATNNLVKGAYVPFFLPVTKAADIGHEVQTKYLDAVQKSYHDVYPQYSFNDHNVGGLDGRLSVAADSRHDRLLDAASKDVVVGIYFPALLEYSVPAAIEFVGKLPEKFLLAGGFDTCAAFVAEPGLLFDAQNYPPLLWMAGLKGEKETIGYHFEAYGYNLTFNRRPHLNETSEYWASALVVLG